MEFEWNSGIQYFFLEYCGKSGESQMGLNFIMERSGIPIQEFNTTTLTTLAIAVVLILRPRKAVRSSRNR